MTYHASGVCGGYRSFRAEPAGLCAARAYLRDISRLLGLSGEQELQLLIASGEAISNAYLHGSPQCGNDCIYLDWHFSDGKLVICVHDQGDPASRAARAEQLSELSPYRGNGFGLMRAMVDSVELEHENGTRVVLTQQTCSRVEAPGVTPAVKQPIATEG